MTDNQQKSALYHDESIDHAKRTNIKPGLHVAIVLKKDQPTGRLTYGVVQDLLTSVAHHPRGIKVRLTDDQVGRVQAVYV